MKWMGLAALLPWLVATPLVAQTPAAPDAQMASEPESGPVIEAEREPAVDLSTEAEPVRPVLIPTAHFAARSGYRDFVMSPDGSRLAVEQTSDGVTAIAVYDAETLEQVRDYKLTSLQRADSFRWAGNDKLIVSVSMPALFFGFPVRINRLFVRNLTTGDAWVLDTPADVVWGGEIIHIADDGSFVLVSAQKNYRDNPAVYRHELVPGAERERIVRPQRGIWSWTADDAGVVRLGFGGSNRRLKIYYRETADDDFELVDKLRPDDERARVWNVIRIVSGSDTGFVLEDNEEGRVGVRLADYSTGEILDTFYENPDWDVEELWLDRDGEPLAALYTDDRDQIQWFDEDMERLHRQVGEALGQETVRIITRSRGNERMLVWAGSESDPGALYVFTPETPELKLLGNFRPEIDFSQLASTQAIRYTARDGLKIAAYLTLPRGREARGLPLIILPHGGPFGIRDKLQYNDEVQLLANRGYAVLQPNFRGSGGYGEDFYERGHGEVGRGMQDDLDDAMDWAVAEGIADPKRVCVVGGSYGGYAALWAVLRNPERYRCAASWAGVTDWDRMLRYDRKFLSRDGRRRWESQIEGEDDVDLRELSPYRQAERLNRPVLLAHGTNDSNVPFTQFEDMVKASERAPIPPTALAVRGAGHSFLRASHEKKWYDALDAFLAEHNPADQLDSAGRWVPPVDPIQENRFIALEIGASSTGDAGDAEGAVQTGQSEEQGATGDLPNGEPSS